MSTTQMRELLHDYIDKADERLLNLILAMVRADMKEEGFELSDNHKGILNQRLENHKENPDIGSNWDEVRKRIEDQL